MDEVLRVGFLEILMPLVVGYMCGSIPSGLIFTRMAGMGDVRSIGSGNIGATNVLRTGRKGIAFATLLADMLKATVPMVLVLFLSGKYEPALFAGFFAFLGHLFPIWLNFKGGKGIASYVGVTLGMGFVVGNWWGLLAFAVAWLLTAFALRWSSLAALVATVAVPVVYWLTDDFAASGITAAMGVISWIMHRSNIRRLLDGTEPKIGAK